MPMRLSAYCPIFCTLAVPGLAVAQVDTASFDEESMSLSQAPPELSTDLMDTGARTRFHLVTRASFANGGDSFGGASNWTFIPKFMVSPVEGFVFGGVIPFALFDPAEVRTVNLSGTTTALGGDTQFILGNVRLSGAAGFSVALDPRQAGDKGPRLHFGFGLDVYLPTLTDPDDTCDELGVCAAATAARALHAYEPELFLPETVLARPRTQIAFSAHGLRATFEMGIAVGAYFEGPFEGDPLALFDLAGRLSYDIADRVEPFFELTTHGTLAHPDVRIPAPSRFDASTNPAELTTGVRLYLGELTPAFFATIDLDEPIVFFGVDFAGVVRTAPQRSTGGRDVP